MKNNHLVFSALALVAALLGVTSANAQTEIGVANIVRISGSAEYATVDSSNATWLPLKLDQQLKPGVILRTGKDSIVDVVVKEGFDFTFRPDPHRSASPPPVGFPPPRGVNHIPPARQTIVRLMSGTTMKLVQLEYITTGADTVSHTTLDIRDGTIFFNVKKLNAMSSFVMKSRVSVASIRGSSGYDSANGDTGMFSGSEEVNSTYVDSNGNVQDVTHVVSGGQSLNCVYSGGNSGSGSGNNTGNGNNGGLPSGPPNISQSPSGGGAGGNVPSDPGGSSGPPNPNPNHNNNHPSGS